MNDSDFKGAFLMEANFRDTNLAWPLFQGAFLQGADFRGAHLHSARFKNARLQGADFRRAELHWPEFEGADLTDVNFAGAKLHRPDFRGAIVDAADLVRADMHHPRFEGALWVNDLRPFDPEAERRKAARKELLEEGRRIAREHEEAAFTQRKQMIANRLAAQATAEAAEEQAEAESDAAKNRAKTAEEADGAADQLSNIEAIRNFVSDFTDGFKKGREVMANAHAKHLQTKADDEVPADKGAVNALKTLMSEDMANPDDLDAAADRFFEAGGQELDGVIAALLGRKQDEGPAADDQ